MTESRALSYREIAKTFDITVPSARNMVRRRMWHRVPSNDPKTVRVLVPAEEIPVRGPTADATRDASSNGSSENYATSRTLPDDARDGLPGATSKALAILAKHIEALQAELEPLRATAAQVAGLNAALDGARDDASRLREERDRWQEQAKAAWARAATGPSIPAQRGWWPFRRSA